MDNIPDFVEIAPISHFLVRKDIFPLVQPAPTEREIAARGRLERNLPRELAAALLPGIEIALVINKREVLIAANRLIRELLRADHAIVCRRPKTGIDLLLDRIVSPGGQADVTQMSSAENYPQSDLRRRLLLQKWKEK